MRKSYDHHTIHLLSRNDIALKGMKIGLWEVKKSLYSLSGKHRYISIQPDIQYVCNI